MVHPLALWFPSLLSYSALLGSAFVAKSSEKVVLLSGAKLEKPQISPDCSNYHSSFLGLVNCIEQHLHLSMHCIYVTFLGKPCLNALKQLLRYS